MKFAIIETGGKQYRVAEGETLQLELLHQDAGSSVSFDRVLLIADGDDVKIGDPYVEGAKVTAELLKNARTAKKIVFRYHAKTRYRKFNTHRQDFSEVTIKKI